jgi:3-oxoacyl-[acyl-carrier-protein] synthase-3
LRQSVVLTAPRYILGEIEQSHDGIEDLSSRTEEFRMPNAPGLWGWGQIRRTMLDLDELAIRTARATLADAGADPASVDGLVLCSTKFPGGAEAHGGFVQRIAHGLGLRDAAFHGLTLHRCANLLAGIQLACVLVSAGIHRRVLVVTTDRVEPEASRVEQYALFSDGAASCLISHGPSTSDSYEIVSCASGRDLAALEWQNEISADLAREVNRDLLAGTGLELPDIKALMHANLVTPLVVMKERQAGFSADQMYVANTRRFGHCFAADPLINLVDRGTLGHLRVDDHVILAASVPGERFALLLRCRTLPEGDEAAVNRSQRDLIAVSSDRQIPLEIR